MSACTIEPCKVFRKITLCTKGLFLASACLSVTTIYSIYSLQVKTWCLPIHQEASLTTTLTYGVLSHFKCPLGISRIFTNLCINISPYTISHIVLSNILLQVPSYHPKKQIPRIYFLCVASRPTGDGHRMV